MRALILKLSLLSAGALTGCANLHLYNKDADQTATAASVDYDSAKLSDALRSQHIVFDMLEQKEVDAFHKVIITQRDLDLLSLIESDDTKSGTVGAGFISRFMRRIDNRLIELRGSAPNSMISPSQYENARTALGSAEVNYRKQQLFLANMTIVPDFKLPECSTQIVALANDTDGSKTVAIVEAKGKSAAEILGNWQNAIRGMVGNAANVCSLLLQNRSIVDAFKPAAGSLLSSALRDYDAITDRIKIDTFAAKNRREALAASALALATANKEREAADKFNDYTCPAMSSAPAPTAPNAISAPEEPSKRICAILDALSALGDAGVKEVAEIKLAKIRAVLAALSGVAPAEKDGKLDESLALLSAATRLGRALDQYQRSSTLPALEPLIIEKQLADVQLAYANAGLKLQGRQLANAKAKFDAVLLEIALLKEAQSEISIFGTIPFKEMRCGKETIFCDSIEAILRKDQRNFNGTPVYRTAYRGLELFAESYTVARDRQMGADVRSAAADYQDSLIRSEAAVASWRAVIETPVSQIRDYHAGGLKPETLAALLQAFGIFGIAVK